MSDATAAMDRLELLINLLAHQSGDLEEPDVDRLARELRLIRSEIVEERIKSEQQGSDNHLWDDAQS